MVTVSGGICAAKGFKANGIYCGIRKNKDKKDLALVVSDVPASAAAVYTQNLVKGAPLLVTKENLYNGVAQAIICNSGNANTCNANGVEIAKETCDLVAKQCNISPEDVIVASTGVIGQPLSIDPIQQGIEELVKGLGLKSHIAAEAIMTTDTKEKELAVSFQLGDVQCHLGGIAKGSGMIHPNMATMLVFLTTDVAISPELLQDSLIEDVETTFNMISVDGDTSTNDMVSILANGMAGNKKIITKDMNYVIFKEVLHYITVKLCEMIAQDGEGATKLLECRVIAGCDEEATKKVAKSVICSSLVKTAMFGEDANWGRILCAVGYSGAEVDIEKIDVSFKSTAGEIQVCSNGAGIDFSEEYAKKILKQPKIEILINLNSGDCTATAWGCDLSYDYVKINGDYRT